MPATIIPAQGVVEDGSLPVRAVPCPQTITLAAGGDSDVRVTAVDSSGAAVSLTGATCTLGINQWPTAPGSPLLSVVGVVEGSPNTNVVDFALSAAQTTTLGAGTFAWDVLVVWPDGKTTQLVPASVLVVAPAF